MRVKIEPITEDELRRMYLDDKMTMSEIGKKIGVSYSTIHRFMESYDIPRRTNSEAHLSHGINIPITKDELCQMYLDDGMSQSEIGEKFSVDNMAISRWMKFFGILARTKSESHLGRGVVIPGEKELYTMHWDKNMTTREIAKSIGVSNGTIYNLMQSHNIPRRTVSEACLLLDRSGPNHPNWTGGPRKYCYKFSPRFREAVRERDDYTCQNCGFEQKLGGKKLSVHHIHYDAENCYPDVISLCHSCHMSSNGNRDAWETHYWCILAERGLLEWEPPWAEERDENDT